jgi:hypothetical protein
MKKPEMIETAKALGAPVAGNETVEQLGALIAAANDPVPEPAPVQLKRAKIHRGASRRITRAGEAIDKALDEFGAEMDRQVFAMGDDGERIGPWPFLRDVAAFRAAVKAAVAGVMDPNQL